MTDLSVDLSINISVSLSGDIAGAGLPTWQLGLDSIEGNWLVGSGETIVSDNLDVWTDRVGGHTLTSPSASRRPTPGAEGGWQGSVANQVKMNAAAAIPAMMTGNQAYTWIVAFSDFTSNNAHWGAQNTARTQLIKCNTWPTDTIFHDRNSGTLQRCAGSGLSWTSGGIRVVACTYNGTQSNLYFDGPLVAGPVAAGNAVTVDDLSIMGIPHAARYSSGEVYEYLFCSTDLVADAIADATENPPRYPWGRGDDSDNVAAGLALAGAGSFR